MSNLISLFFILVSIGVFFGYVNPTYTAVSHSANRSEKSIRELKEEKARYIEALNKTKEIEQARTGLLEEFARIPEEGRARLLKLLPDHIDSVRLIIDINTVAGQYGMALKNITLVQSGNASKAPSLSLGPRDEDVKSVGLKFSVEGSYDVFRAFLRDLEQSLRLVDIDMISFSSREEPYEYVISLSTYRLSADTPI